MTPKQIKLAASKLFWFMLDFESEKGRKPTTKELDNEFFRLHPNANTQDALQVCTQMIETYDESKGSH